MKLNEIVKTLQEERAKIDKLGWDKLWETLQQRLREQKGRHQGGSKWIGTGGTSPFGNGGYNPQGIRIGGKGGNKSAVKVWEQRAYRDYDDTLELGTRNIKVALRRLRRFAREGSELELDLDGTIHGTAANAGMLDIRMQPERHNKVKVLLLMDVGGTMDEHIHRVEELFSAVKSEFKHLEFYYFHNCLYDFVWKDNRRRHSERTKTWDLLHKYNHDYKVVFVGDAAMSPYEIAQPGGSAAGTCPVSTEASWNDGAATCAEVWTTGRRSALAVMLEYCGRSDVSTAASLGSEVYALQATTAPAEVPAVHVNKMKNRAAFLNNVTLPPTPVVTRERFYSQSKINCDLTVSKPRNHRGFALRLVNSAPSSHQRPFGADRARKVPATQGHAQVDAYRLFEAKQ